jgi:hypothetical protein
MVINDGARVISRLGAPLQVLMLSAAAWLLVVLLHGLGYALAAELGRTVRGGVGWDGLMRLALAVFALLTLLQNYAALRWPDKRWQIAVTIWLLFAVPFTLLCDPLGGWSHPYRYLYLLCCTAVGVCLSLAGQHLFLRWRQRHVSYAAMA